jgi:hypothetical protein
MRIICLLGSRIMIPLLSAPSRGSRTVHSGCSGWFGRASERSRTLRPRAWGKVLQSLGLVVKDRGRRRSARRCVIFTRSGTEGDRDRGRQGPCPGR